MQSISKRLSIMFVLCAIAAILLVTLFVNITISNQFNEYMIENQNKRYERIVRYLEEIYKQEGSWTENAGVELVHEAYMGNYCLTLKNKDKEVVWGMDPGDMQNHLDFMPVQNTGVYTTKTFEIKDRNNIIGYVDIGQYSSVLLTEEDITFKSAINKSIMASGVVSLAIVILLSIYFSRQFSQPIKEAADMSVSLSKGNFVRKSSIKSNIKELDTLRKSVNILAGKLKYQDLLRRRLVSDISHEIRTPLNVLQNNLEAMIDGVFPVTSEKLNSLNEEVIRFGKLIGDLNMLKEFEMESSKLMFEPVYLDEVIKDIYEDFQMAAKRKGIKLDLFIKPNHKYLVEGDKDKLKQVFINLIVNAIKFTHSTGEIFIHLSENKKNIVFKVEDNGQGIAKEDLPFIFERLYRGDQSRSQTEGKGIGLTIVKNILQLHHAAIDVSSEPGKGTIFTVYFDKMN